VDLPHGVSDLAGDGKRWKLSVLIYVNIPLDLPEYAMSTDDAEWIASYLAAEIERMRAAHALIREMLNRSYEQLAKSEELLKLGVPRVWHPEPPKGCPAVPSANQGDDEASRAAARAGLIRDPTAQAAPAPSSRS